MVTENLQVDVKRDMTHVTFSMFPTIKVRDMLREFVASAMDTTADIAAQFLAELVNQGLVDPEKCIPTSKGMALTEAENRSKISKKEGERLICTLLEAAKKINSRSGARVFVEQLYVFGSYLQQVDSIGDIDIVAVIPLPDDCEPKDLDEMDAVGEMLRVSEYISLHDGKLDAVASAAEKQLIYARGQA